MSALAAACTSAPERDPFAVVDAEVGARVGSGLRPPAEDAQAPPPGVDLSDGLAEEEAVALALWRDPGFAADLAQLGLARADVAQAGLLANPSLSFLFALGPKQWETALRFPLDPLLHRPLRIELAQAEQEALAQRLVHGALELAREARHAFAERVAAQEELAAALREAELVTQRRERIAARFELGAASERELSAARRVELAGAAAAARARGRAEQARLKLASHVGGDAAAAVALAPELPATPPRDVAALLATALAARPDVRAAELALESAATREALARRSWLEVGATIDANGEGDAGAEVGPGVDVALPLFDRGQARVERARAEQELARRRLGALRTSIEHDVRAATSRLAESLVALAEIAEPALALAEADVARTEAALAAGAASELELLDVELARVAAHRERSEACASIARARADLEAALGMRWEPDR